MYLLDIAWNNAAALDRVRITRPIAAQLYRAVGSIGADIAEGYSRSSGLDRARFLEYGLGSTRESGVWYRSGLRVLGRRIHDHRVDLLMQIRRMLLTTIPAERVRRIRPIMAAGDV
jgi:four helix bundle protein